LKCHINTSVLVKLKHLVDGFQHGFDVFIVVRWQLADVQFVQRGHPLVWEEPLLFCTLVGFQVVGDVKKLQLLCLDTENISAEDYQWSFGLNVSNQSAARKSDQ
jgi:hypothetical protein